jgi:ankyrin repeat protein
MTILDPAAPLAVALVSAIQHGEVGKLRELLTEHPDLATARIGPMRTLLHIVTDWPGHFPQGPETVATLVSAGAEVNAAAIGPHAETPLHWAASSNDVAVLEALLAAGANLEAPGSVIDGGTALADAVAFGQWEAASRLIAEGARTTLWQAAALGLEDRVAQAFAEKDAPGVAAVTNAFWCACHGGQMASAAYLLARGAELNWVGHDGLTPLDAAARSGATTVVDWLREQGGKSAAELG